MLRKVKLYGELADFVGHKELDAVINSTADAIRFLVSNFPKLEAHMSQRYYKVLVDNYEIGEEDIQNPIGKSDISIVPVISGAGGGSKLLLGAALIGGAFLFTPLSMGSFFSPIVAPGSFAAAMPITKAALALGGALVLSGVSDMLFPVPKPKEFKSEQDPQLSFSFSGTQNTSRAGTPVPIVYGEIVTGSVVISGAIDTQQVQA